MWDVFISHAAEDKAEVAEPLSEALENLGLRVWLDSHELTVGDSIREKLRKDYEAVAIIPVRHKERLGRESRRPQPARRFYPPSRFVPAVPG